MVHSVKGQYLRILAAYPFVYGLVMVVLWLLQQSEALVGEAIPSIVLWLCLLPIAYYLLFFRFLGKRFGRNASYIVGILVTLIPIVVAGPLTGGYASTQDIAWVVIIFLSGMLGVYVPISLIWLHIVAYVLSLTGSLQQPNVEIGWFVVWIYIAAGFFGWLFFRRWYVHESPAVDKLRQTLRDEQLRSEAVLEAITDGIVITSKKGVIQHANPVAIKILGLELDALIGKNITARNNLFSVKYASIKAHSLSYIFHQAIEAHKTITIDLVTLLRRDKSTVDISISVIPLKNDDDHTGAFMLLIHDISVLAQTQRLKDDFIAIASHELRTPATVITGYADLLLNPRFGELSSDQRHYIERTKKTSQDLTHLINDMLDLSSLETGAHQNKPRQIKLLDFCHQIVNDSRGHFAEKQIALSLKGYSSTVKVDGARLHQVITNLLSNAYKYTPEKGIVTLTIVNNPDEVEISVSDNGPGIAKKDQAIIFEKFSRLQINTSVEGTGLGLAICRQIVDAWGGTIGVDSKEGEGATFYFTIPFNNKKHSSGEGI